MNALDLLKDDHEKVKSIFQHISSLSQSAERSRRSQFEKLQQELKIHTSIEEQIFYPALETHNETKDIIKESYKEHKQVDSLCQEIARLNPTDNKWIGKIGELQNMVERHVRQEEGELFKRVRQIFDKQVLEDMGRRMEAAKKGEAAKIGKR